MKISDDRPFFFILAGLFLILTVLSVLLISVEHRRSLLILEYEVEKSSAALFDMYNAGGPVDENYAEMILGFAVYSLSGDLLVYYGDVPASLDPLKQNEQQSTFSVDRRGKTVTMIRRLGYFPSIMGSPNTLLRMRRLMPRRQSSPEFVYIEIEAKGILSKGSLFGIAYGLVPAIIAVVMAAVGLLYRRNLLYKKKIAAQENLVHLGQVARTLSHEIRNPLSAIQIHTGILMKTLSEERHEDLRVIEEEVQRIRMLVDRIGEFLRNPKGTPEAIDITLFIRELLERYEWNVKITGEKGPVSITFDRERLRLVLENLIKNAIESTEDMPEDQRLVWIEIHVQKNKVQISIFDNGKGLPDGNPEHLFDLFFTTKEKGSGIGLAISKRFVATNGGSIDLIRRQEGGTEARVAFERIERR